MSTGEELEIHDDLIAKAIRELAGSIGRKWTLINMMEELLGTLEPIVQYVAAGDDHVKKAPAPAKKAEKVLAACAYLRGHIDEEKTRG
jgi:hypothetical protein